MNIRKILLPIDFPNLSLHAIHQAAALARHFHAEIVMLHVLTNLSHAAGVPKEGPELGAWDMLAEVLATAQKHGDASLAAELDGLVGKRLLAKGDPAHAIVRASREEHADLIVMPSHGYGAFYRFLLGSVTAKVLHESECPVWTGAHLEEAPAKLDIRHILCAVDLRAHSHTTVARAVELAAGFSARLTLVHVTPGVEMYGPGGTYVDTKWKAMLVNIATERMAAFQRGMGTHLEVLIVSGDVPGTLQRTAKEAQADLLMIGCRPSGGRLRTNGYSIVRESQIPVLSV